MPPSVFPSPPSSGQSPIKVFPSDLFSSVNLGNPNVTGGGTGATTGNNTVTTTAEQGFYTQIQMVDSSQVLTGPGFLGQNGRTSSGYANPQNGGGVYLPLPWKINDVEMHIWNDFSFMDYIPIIDKFIQAKSRIFGEGGAAVNPYMYMLYKQPAFREFELAWSFSPTNEQENITLHEIINYLKTGALPEYGTLVLHYPWIALIRMNPNKFLFDFKPCAITSVNIDFSGSQKGPSFYKDGGPTVVNFSLGLKEVEIQVRSDTAYRAGDLVQTYDFG